jgi:uncharacterized protein (TIGR00290 family)
MRMGLEVTAALHHLYPKDFQIAKTVALLEFQSTVDQLERGDDSRQITSGGWIDSPSSEPCAANTSRIIRSRLRVVCVHPRTRFSMADLARPQAWLAWSSGKDSAWALHTVRQRGEFEVVALLTTINRTHRRVAMHAVREALVERQAAATGVPWVKVEIPSACTNEVYEQTMSQAMARARDEGVRHVVFGDLFLEDIRVYREKHLKACGMTPVFPLWGKDTRRLAEEMLAGELSAFLTCVDPRKLDRKFAGRRFDAQLLRDLPPGIDPCGENGEFHTFANAGPMFARDIPVSVGEIVGREGFVFADLIPAPTAAGAA